MAHIPLCDSDHYSQSAHDGAGRQAASYAKTTPRTAADSLRKIRASRCGGAVYVGAVQGHTVLVARCSKLCHRKAATHDGRSCGQKLHKEVNNPSSSQPRVFDISSVDWQLQGSCARHQRRAGLSILLTCTTHNISPSTGFWDPLSPNFHEY